MSKLVNKIVDDVPAIRSGYLECHICRRKMAMTSEEAAYYLAHGWPTCHGQTMTLETLKKKEDLFYEERWSKDYVKKLIKVAAMAKKDSDKANRIQYHECIGCYYKGRLHPKFGAQAFTAFVCEMCGENCSHPHSAVPKFCRNCSVKENICVNCGSDLWTISNLNNP